MTYSRYFFLALLLVLIFCSSFGIASEKPMDVVVSILPQKYFVERIGGDRVEVSVLVGPGQSPATYEPTPKQMATLSNASVYFNIGVPFEKRLMTKIKSMIPNLNISDAGKSVKNLSMEEHDHHNHDHGNNDPHIWMDPKLAQIIAANIAEELIRIDSAHSDFFKSKLSSLQQDLERLDAKISTLLKPYKGRPFMVFHPSYGYFAKSYGLVQVAVEHEGKSPGPKQIAMWIDKAKKENIKVIFVQPQFSASSAKTIAEAVGAKVRPVDPLAEDYIKNLESIAQTFDEALSK